MKRRKKKRRRKQNLGKIDKRTIPTVSKPKLTRQDSEKKYPASLQYFDPDLGWIYFLSAETKKEAIERINSDDFVLPPSEAKIRAVWANGFSSEIRGVWVNGFSSEMHLVAIYFAEATNNAVLVEEV